MARLKIGNKNAKSTNDEVKSKGPGSGLKAFVIMLILMDLLAAGSYGYLTLVRSKKVSSERNRARNNLLRVKQGGEEISQALEELKNANSEKVLDPQTPILKAARGMQIDQHLTVGNPSSKRFSGAKGWDEWTVQVGFREKRGYAFLDLVNFCRAIEGKNSKAQVKAINFGKRDRNTEGTPHWRPTSMTVRVFKPTDR